MSKYYNITNVNRQMTVVEFAFNSRANRSRIGYVTLY